MGWRMPRWQTFAVKDRELELSRSDERYEPLVAEPKTGKKSGGEASQHIHKLNPRTEGLRPWPLAVTDQNGERTKEGRSI